ncbi:MAG: TlpA disulfide reductase family protein [Reyranellaceae bacterium]
MAYPVGHFLSGRRRLLAVAGAAAVVQSIAPAARAEVPAGLVKGTMKRFKVTNPPKPLPNLEFFGAGDQPMHLADLNGKARLINLWATWCGPCVKEMPSLDRLQSLLPKDKFVVLPISLDGPTKGKVAPFYKDQNLGHLGIYYDKGKTAMSTLGVTLLPTSILVDPSGRELGRLEGDADWDTPDGLALIKAALAGHG